ncbi:MULTISPECIES: HpcH/HpaI aldolase/citrate lyase family protein [unclassified Burkholderia]|uniref:HpcH/HpaI aldolase family protein n=1 Tax=unclassified Burkholderia TaxID=2613784 RepID=UPI000F591695|nr:MULTISPECIES: aldolase/citrate lyase family protein [unclassified Burkholderia]RQR32198.1 aldolase [Burkholderia sp. Bp9131]RQR70810.1 aldolase [Burkholderia sp. Bp9015]
MEESEGGVVLNRVKNKLAKDEVVLSMTARLVRTAEIAVIAKTAGFDSIYIDLEHSSFSVETTSQICMAALGQGITPFVRVPAGAPDDITRVLDGGALGVIAPHVQSADEAAAVVQAAKYPPTGTRSFTGGLPHVGFRSMPTDQLFAAMNDATMVVVMIETGQALDQVDAIAAVEGVDMLFVGTNDLCASLGITGQLQHELIKDAYRRCLEACRKHGKHLGVGGLGGDPEFVRELVALGARYISSGTDLSFLYGAAAEKARRLRF